MLHFPSLTDIPSAYLESMLDEIFHGYMVVNSKGIVVSLNNTAKTLYNTNPPLAVGIPLSDVAPADWVEVRRVLSSGQNQNSNVVTLAETEVLISRLPVFHNNQTIGVICLMQDFSLYEGHIHKLNAYRQMNDELEAVLEQISDAVLLVDPAGIVTRVNSAYERLALVSSQALTGRHIDKLRRDPADLLPLVREVLEKGTRAVVKGEGSTFAVRISATPAFDHNGALSMVLGRVHKEEQTEAAPFAPQLSESPESLPPPAPLLPLDEDDRDVQRQCAALGMVVHSKAMCRVARQAIKVSQVDSAVLIQGESGVGKSMLASLIHHKSPRREKPFVVINCGVIPEALMESELFGYEKGAFTGAAPGGKVGLIESANHGTVFFDEIGELKLHLQVKLLEVIEQKSFMRVGGTKRIFVDIRSIAATNRDLEAEVDAGTFRKDLFYRLNVIPLRVPPLRERKEDIAAMVTEILHKCNARYKEPKRVAAQVIQWLMQYPFPGNTRELVNIMEWMLVMAEGQTIGLGDLPIALQKSLGQNLQGQEESPVFPIPAPDFLPLEAMAGSMDILPLKEAMLRLEETYIRHVVGHCPTLQEAARLLDVHFTTLWRKMRGWQAENPADEGQAGNGTNA